MKLRADIVKMYKEIHGWVGILSGLALFIAFYAGAITMFEEPLQRWATPPTRLAPPPSIDRAPELVAKVLAAHPQAARDYDIVVTTDRARPARMMWEVELPGSGGERGEHERFFASLAPNGDLQLEKRGPSSVAQFIDVLHQQVGLPFGHEIAMPIMGVIALLYVIAIISGVIVLLPSLVKDLFALRISKNVKRMWLDVHNVLGLFSLPFHVIMALTAVVFAFHDQFYDAQGMAFGGAEDRRPPISSPPRAPALGTPVLTPKRVLQRVREQAPGFNVQIISYGTGSEGQPTMRVTGDDWRYGLRGPTFGFAGIDPHSGMLTMRDYMPGHQDGWSAIVSSFFALHFGNFGGAPVRWTYFLLGLAGAMLFYTGNLLWVESRRQRERKAGLPEQTRATRILGALTTGVPLGCVAGISTTIAAAKPFGYEMSMGQHSAIYYSVFAAFMVLALLRGPARSGVELSIAAALATLLVPLANLIAAGTSYASESTLGIDAIAVAIAATLCMIALSAHRRATRGAADSIWARPKNMDSVRT